MSNSTASLAIPVFETRRLLLRGITLQDAPSYQRHFNDYEVISQLASVVPWPYPDKGAEDFIRTFILPQQGRDRWFWGIFLKDNPGEMIGGVDLWRNGSPENRGFWLARKFWGKGLMTEAVEPVMDYAFADLGFDKLIFSNALGNTKSRRIKEKTGARLIGARPAKFVSQDYTEAETWELTKVEWAHFKSRVKSTITFSHADPALAEWWFCDRQEAETLRFNPIAPSTVESLKERLSKASSDLALFETSDSYFWFVKENDQIVGHVTMQNINRMMLTAEIGYGISASFRGRGLATVAVHKLATEAFSKTSLRKLIAFVHDGNVPSRKALENVGFRQEGILREHYLVNGIPTNEIIYGLLRSDLIKIGEGTDR